MPTRIAVLAFLCACPLAFGQLASNTVTVTASQNSTLQPDQAIFNISIGSDVNTTLSTVLTAVQPGGLTLANFSGISSSSTSTTALAAPTNLQWLFVLDVPLASINTTVTALTNLATSVPQANKSLTVSFAIVGTQVSQQLQQSQTCNIPALITQAQTQAQNLASAGGRSVGGILAMSGATSTTSAQNCSLTVKFSLLGS
jgi:Protein of unknown function (DUF541)